MPIFHQPGNSVGNHSYNVYIYDRLDYDLHFHKNFEVIYVISGQASCCVNNRTKTLLAGEFAFCFSNEVHSIRSLGESRIWIGVFSEDFIQEFANYQHGKTGEDFSFRCADGIMLFLSEHLIRETLSDVFMIKACLYALCSEYLRQIPLLESGSRDGSFMQSSLDYIERGYRNTLSLSGLAKHLGYDYCYCSRTFNRLFSMHFDQYVNIYRFNAACALLTETALSITQISYESGFQSLRSFNQIFKKLAGIPPKVYRTRAKAER